MLTFERMNLKTGFDRNKAKELGAKMLAAIGIIAVLVFFAFGAIRAGTSLPEVFSRLTAAAASLSSIFTPADRLTAQAPESVRSGEAFELSWSRRHAGAGTYTISYACGENTSVTAENAVGVFENTFCDTPFNFGGATSSARLIATTRVAEATLPITVAFTPENASERAFSDSVNVAVKNPSATNMETETAAATSTAASDAAQTPVRKAGEKENTTYVIGDGRVPHSADIRPDLAVVILAVGAVNRTTNEFTATSSIRYSERGAVRFSVENRGGKASGPWLFAAVLPTVPLYTFNSELQRSLNPGDHIEFTLGFDSIDKNGTGKITVNADPANSVAETTEENNIVSANIQILPQQ